MAFEFKLPDIGEGVVEGEIVKWKVSEGETIKLDQPMVEVMTDKATVEIPAPRAGKVLKSRVLAGDAPEVAQMIGVSIAEWADLGLLLEIDNVASAGNWNGALFPTIQALVTHRRHVVAAPVGIHRVNTLFYNRALFAQLRIAPPQSWADFEDAARKLRAAGVTPLALSSEAWQVATLFENLLLAESGPDFYRQLFVRRDPAAAADRRTAEALQRLRIIKGWANGQIEERSWPEVARQFARREAAMMIMGDWAKPELRDQGMTLDEDFACGAPPGTSPRRASGSSSTSGRACRRAATSTRSSGSSCRTRGSPTSTSTRSWSRTGAPSPPPTTGRSSWSTTCGTSRASSPTRCCGRRSTSASRSG